MKPLSEVIMLDTRRCFLKNLAGVSSSVLLFQSSPPIPAQAQDTVDPPSPPNRRRHHPRTHPEARNAHDCKRKKKSFAKRWCSSSQSARPQTPGRCPPPLRCFSIAIFKQTQEIEKLAKQLKNYAA